MNGIRLYLEISRISWRAINNISINPHPAPLNIPQAKTEACINLGAKILLEIMTLHVMRARSRSHPDKIFNHY